MCVGRSVLKSGAKVTLELRTMVQGSKFQKSIWQRGRASSFGSLKLKAQSRKLKALDGKLGAESYAQTRPGKAFCLMLSALRLHLDNQFITCAMNS
jgi:hypothetical protein